jgi:hypothetical protein
MDRRTSTRCGIPWDEYRGRSQVEVVVNRVIQTHGESCDEWEKMLADLTEAGEA